MKKLYETINEENWCQGWFWEGEQACIIGHLIKLNQYMAYDQSYETLKQLIPVINLLYPKRGKTVQQFNDHPETTVEDVIRVCKMADV